MKRWKKYAALLLALIMCLSMAACGGDEEGAPDTIKNLVTDTSIEYDYSALMGTWLGEDDSVLTMEHVEGITNSERFLLHDADNSLTASGNIQYVEEYGYVYLYNEHDGIAHICWFNEDDTLYIDSFGTFTKVSGDVPGETVGDEVDLSVLRGTWYLDGDTSASRCIEFDSSGTMWSIYERNADGLLDGVDGGTLRVTGANRYEAASDWYDDEIFDCYLEDNMLYWGSGDGSYEVYY